jgi:iron uptake system component EfeO
VKRLTTAACVVTTLAAAPACSLTESNEPSASGGNGTVNVESSADDCALTSKKAPSGNVVFKVKNTGSEVTEFYFYAEDGLRIVGEIENVGPGLSRDLVVRAAPGTYITACKPGMTGKGIRSEFTVTDSGKSTAIKGVDQATINAATSQYAAYVKDQSQQLVAETTTFTDAYKAGKDDEARTLFPLARQYWERIETVAESFGDLDPRMDLREADLEQGQEWTGWHRIEKDLWPPASGYQALEPAERAKYADDLLANTKVLHQRVQTLSYSVDQIGNGSKGLLDEVASGKITGEEDIWSHTDLYDFQANVDGARVGFEGLKPLLEVKDAALSKQIETAFDALQAELDKYKVGTDGFVFYDKVSEVQRKRLSDATNALAEPLSKMTGAITL